MQRTQEEYFGYREKHVLRCCWVDKLGALEELTGGRVAGTLCSKEGEA